jgi:hypothetical protein
VLTRQQQQQLLLLPWQALQRMLVSPLLLLLCQGLLRLGHCAHAAALAAAA